MTGMVPSRASNLLISMVLIGVAAAAADEPDVPPLAIHRASGPIKIDGDLSDEGWKGAARRHLVRDQPRRQRRRPRCENVGYLAYDDKFFYAGVRVPGPRARARSARPLGDRDNVPSDTDYGGVILDTRNDGKTGDAVPGQRRAASSTTPCTDDTGGGEDSSPDFFWDAAGAHHRRRAGRSRSGSRSRRCATPGPTRRPGASCSTATTPATSATRCSTPGCRAAATASSAAAATADRPRRPALGRPPGARALRHRPATTARPRTARARRSTTEPVDGDVRARREVDARPRAPPSTPPSTPTSRRSSPTWRRSPPTSASPSSSPRSGRSSWRASSCFSTPIQAVYTRTITAPRWGVRGTGKSARTAYTALVAEDGGGGSVILPGPNGSDLADQDFRSLVAAGAAAARHRPVLRERARHRPRDPRRRAQPGLRARLPVAARRTGHRHRPGALQRQPDARPARPRRRSGTAGRSPATRPTPGGQPFHEDRRLVRRVQGLRRRASAPTTASCPRSGYRAGLRRGGYTFRPEGFPAPRCGPSSSPTTPPTATATCSTGGSRSARAWTGKWNSFLRVWYAFDRVRAGETTLPRQQLLYIVQRQPLAAGLDQISLEGFVGEEIDFDERAAPAPAPTSVSARPCVPPTTWSCASTTAGGG